MFRKFRQRSLFTLLALSIIFLTACGGGSSAESSSENSTLVAQAGSDQNATLGSTVILNASSSYDTDGGFPTYKWALVSVPNGSNAVLSDATIVNPSFTADIAGTYIASLIVNNGKVDSAPDSVTITVTSTKPVTEDGEDESSAGGGSANSAPVAQAGSDQDTTSASMVTLDASSSYDADGDPLTYQWALISVPDGGSALLSDPTAVNPVLAVGGVGSYVISLTVNDGKVDSQADTVTITVVNSIPVANAGSDKSSITGESITLDGSASYDSDYEPLTFRWTLVSTPEGSSTVLSDATKVKPSFTADIDGRYVASLIVSDGKADSEPATVTITATNVKPVADAGPDLHVQVGQEVTLDGSASSDANHGPLTYSWVLVSVPEGSHAALSDPTVVNPTFTADVEGIYHVALTVNDGEEESETSSMAVTAHRPVDHLLQYRVFDAEYDRTLDKIVMVAANPNQLHIFDPETGDDTTVSLSLTPTSVSVSPDGQHAAVGHDAWVSYVDLMTATVVKTIPVSTDVLDIVLAGNGYIYAFPVSDQWESIRCINIATEEETTSGDWSIYAGTVARLHPNGSAIYGANNGLSPSDIEKYGITNGTAENLYDSPYHGDYAMCGDLWISKDGLRIFTKCGNVFRSSDIQEQDMVYNGSLSDINRIKYLDHSSAANKVIALPENRWDETDEDTHLNIYNYDFLQYKERIPLPYFIVNNNPYKGRGRFVFFNSSGTRFYVVLQADESSGMLSDFGVVNYNVLD